MKFNPMKRVVATLLAGTVALGSMAPAAHAAIIQVVIPGGSPAMEFQSTPSWVTVPGARGVYVVRDDMRPSQDIFRYNNRYYVYSGGNWYRSNRLNGRYVVVNERNLPVQFYDVPQDRWRAYPASWQGKHKHKDKDSKHNHSSNNNKGNGRYK